MPELSVSATRPPVSAGPPRLAGDRGPARTSRRPAGSVTLVVPALAALVFGLWGATAISYDRDEAITVGMARRPLWAILRTLRYDDVVHGLYYLGEHVVFLVFGDGELAMRLPSVLATMVAAAATAALGRRLISPLGGLLAGLLFVVTPTVGHYSHFARSYAIVAALATVVTLLFVRALERGTRRAYAGYALAMATLGVLHFFALLLIAAQLLTVLVSRERRPQLTAIAVGCGCAVIPAIPITLIARHQQALISWAKPPGLPDAAQLVISFTGGPLAATLVITLAAYGAIRRPPVGAPLRGLGEAPLHGPVGVRGLAVPWLVAPPVILMLVSQVHPAYASRYVLLCVPAVALLAAAGAVRLPWRLGSGAVLVALALMMPLNIGQRQASDTLDQFRESAQVVHRGARPGDVVLFLPGGRRAIEDAYPSAFAGMPNIGQWKTPAQAHNLTGSEVGAATLRRRFIPVKRAWLVAYTRYLNCTGRPARKLFPADQVKMDILTSGFSEERCWSLRGMIVREYRRSFAP